MLEGEHKSETLCSEGAWTEQDLKQYLLALSRNNWEQDFCYPQVDFPRRIALSPVFHQTFEEMRAQTAFNQYEYWALVGVTTARDKVVISKHFVRGEDPRFGVPAGFDDESIGIAIREAARMGIPFVVGDVHTHPTDLVDRLIHYGEAFSIVDLYRLVYAQSRLVVGFLVTPRQNLAVFRSRETESVPSSFDQKAFEQFWLRRQPLKFVLGDGIGINRAIARRHHLVLYRGKPHERLMRLFP